MLEWLLRLRPLSRQERAILSGMAQGWTLKSHRYLDGTKQYRIHPLASDPAGAEPIDLPDAPVERLEARKLIQTNHKFPAATFLLTDRGRQAAGSGGEDGPMGPKAFL